MSIIKPFRGVRYNLDKAGGLEELIAPPYDVISKKEREALARRSPYNITHLILPEEKPGDDDRKNKYARAADTWRKWLAQGILARDPRPAIYRYLISFQMKTAEGIVTGERPGFVALQKLMEYSKAKVLPHERTMAGPKEDRFQLMLHTRAHLSQVFMLYPDRGLEIDRLLGDAPPEGIESFGCRDDQGVTHTLWPITDPQVIRKVQGHLDQVRIYIADGHHRYETALALRKKLVQTSPLFAHGSDYLLSYYTPAEHPGLAVLPYHRLVHNLPKRRLSGLKKKLSQHFKVEPALVSPLEPGAPRREFMKSLAERGADSTVFGMVDGSSGQAFYLVTKNDQTLFRSCRSEVDMTLCSMDVVILEDLVLIGMLGMNHKALLNNKYIDYETDYDRILDAVSRPPNQLAFMVNPTPVQDVIKVADLRGVMPEKSTYFYPKLASGLVMNSMED